MRSVILYHTAGCHLCELAEAMLKPLAISRDIAVTSVDIADDEALFARFGVSIPVLSRGTEQPPLTWPFDEKAISNFLDQL